ncbi:cache domain-containing sensor histidine kinase [Paenibacillus soyae]|uniref:histidine kinase n=1 Tax=Paenibacillus soyae TaxID=2969249 RepID=A0A9X2MV91_9BACL|nr:sensor histidine kinase [Paenibacillus soyae]MCR2807671.1 sensor histidine kinase [Paenibacillus soyae]
MWLRFMERNVIRVTRGLNMRGKILLLYGLIVFVPTVFLGIGAGYFTLQSVRDNYMVTMKEAVRQTSQNIDFRKQAYDLLAVRTATDGELSLRLSREHADMSDQLLTLEYVDRSFLSTNKLLPGIEQFRIYHTNETLVQDGRLLWKPEDRPFAGRTEADWYGRTVQSGEPLQWINVPGEEERLMVSHKVFDVNGTSVVGAIYMLLDYDRVFGDLFDQPFNGAGDIYVMDHNRRIVASSLEKQIGSIARIPELESAEQAGTFSDGVLLDDKQIIVETLDSGWSVAAVLHMDQLEKQSRWIVYGIICGIAFFLLLSTFMVLTVLKNIVWRIRKLGSRMNDIAEGEFDVTVTSRDKDELGELEVLFNSMTGKLGTLVDDIAHSKLKEREHSFRALQAQINPHFIYNSLSLIRWRAMDLGDRTQIRAIDALTTFYRLALDNRVNVTRIETELQHVEAYLDIQELRYPGQVQIEWDVDPEVRTYYTIKMLLQPIVENCYVHGAIMQKEGAFIRIAAKKERDRIRFEIQDNGAGMSAETLGSLRAGERTGAGNGFGTANIRERLLLYFGSGSSMTIDSEPGEGTIVAIDIPAYLEQPEIKKGEGL